MNIYIILHLFAIFLTNVNSKPNNQHLISKTNYMVEPSFYIDDLEILKLKVKNVQFNVENIIEQLEHVRTEVEDDTHITVMQKWWDQMDSYKDYVKLLLASMQREVNTAKMKGKDAQHCYDTNLCAISQHSDNAYKAAIKCEESAEKSIEKNLEFINTHTLFGETLITELNNLFLKCYNSDNITMRSCILAELATINNEVKNFEENIKYVKLNTSPVSEFVIRQAKKCMSNAYLWAHFRKRGRHVV